MQQKSNKNYNSKSDIIGTTGAVNTWITLLCAGPIYMSYVRMRNTRLILACL